MSLYILAGAILVIVGGAIFFLRFGKSAGKDAVARDVAEETAETMKAQDKAGAEAAAGDVVSRLRDGEF